MNKITEIKTNPDYWDCECEENYIHSKEKGTHCPKCHAIADDQPDSREDEIKSNYDPQKDIAAKDPVKKIPLTIGMNEEGCQMLADQKLELLKLLDEGKASDQINGVVHLIDAIQDQMVDDGHFPEKVVFPYMEGNDE